jgi:serine/threonine protein kinase
MSGFIKQKLGQGGFSQVYRSSPQTVFKKPKTDLPTKTTQSVVRSYHHQKQLSDYLRSKEPSVSFYFPKIHQIKQNTSYLQDLGNINLFKLVTKPHYAFLLGEHNFDSVMNQLIDAFVRMWSHGVIHKDIKPENIMVRYDIKTLNLTITMIDLAHSLDASTIDRLHRFSFHGTDFYMSPEMLFRKFKSQHSDRKPYGTFEDYLADDPLSTCSKKRLI